MVEVLILVPNLTVWKRKTSRQFALKNWILFYIVVLGLIFVEILELVLKPNVESRNPHFNRDKKAASTICM